jgi:predicted CDP-diglyceride synthetase/phosphatidate cytidylyltransferase
MTVYVIMTYFSVLNWQNKMFICVCIIGFCGEIIKSFFELLDSIHNEKKELK